VTRNARPKERWPSPLPELAGTDSERAVCLGASYARLVMSIPPDPSCAPEPVRFMKDQQDLLAMTWATRRTPGQAGTGRHVSVRFGRVDRRV
jgi:hypothetical protein